MKPYRYRELRRLLRSASEASGGLSAAERTLLRRIQDRLAPAASPAVRWEVSAASNLRANASPPGGFHSANQAKAALLGSLGQSFSYNLNLSLFFDQIDPQTFPPYAYTKDWDGFHIWTEGGEVLVTDGTGGRPGFSFGTQPELSLDLLGGRIDLQLNRTRRAWGIGEGSLSLSGAARPIEALTGSVQVADRWKFHFLAGTLGNWWKAETEQKMFSIHRLEWFPWNWLYLSPWESVIYAKRLELSYLNPLMSYFMGQQLNGDLDNIAFGGEAAISIPPYVRLYVSVFIDELVLVPLERFFIRPNNQYAWQAGLKAPIPWLPFSLLSLQYTKIEPYCYTHYPQQLPTYDRPININYTHDGENLGYPLPPNSDELLLRLFSHPVSGLEITAQYQLIRHGTGRHELGQIEGDIDTPYVYADADLYPDKNFLYDGIYEWINAVRLALGYHFASAPVKVWTEYGFIHSNRSGLKNLLAFGLNASWPNRVSWRKRPEP